MKENVKKIIVEVLNSLSVSRKRILLTLSAALVIGLGAGYLMWSLSGLPQIRMLEEYAPLETTVVYSKDGELLAELFIERRTFLPYYKIPQLVKNAFIATEDARFYHHHGIDFLRTLSAFVSNVKAGGIVQGGSTITQQLAKMLFLKPERNISRKIKEAFLSMMIERHYTKDEILGLYLNQTYFGTRAYGIEAASNTYFGKSTAELTAAESALLAAMPKAPSNYSPFKHPDRAKIRRDYVLRRMLVNNFISEEEYERALKIPLPITVKSRRYRAPYFIEFLRENLEAKYGDRLYTSGIRINSTVDLRMQEAAEAAVTKGIEQIHKRRKKGVQAALLAVDLKSGEIRAMVGGTDFWETQFNRAVSAQRQPGSAFKPFVYLTALNRGMIPDDTVVDTEVTYIGSSKRDLWTPGNYEDEYNGEVTLRTALTHSMNAATVCIADSVGIENVIATARAFGFKSTIQPYLSSALGASDITLIDLVYAYSAFATGKKFDPIYFDRVTDRYGSVLEDAVRVQKKLIDPGVVEEMRDLLSSVIQHGTGSAAKVLNRPLYGKTGTTNDFGDAWFVGFDDDTVVGVWVGRDSHKPIGHKETGATAALPIWIEFMKNYKEGVAVNQADGANQADGGKPKSGGKADGGKADGAGIGRAGGGKTDGAVKKPDVKIPQKPAPPKKPESKPDGKPPKNPDGKPPG